MRITPGIALSSMLTCMLIFSGNVPAATTSRPASAPGTLIYDARIVDGSGDPARTGAVRIRGERIVEVGALAPQAGETLVDARGLVLAPGFIDTHNHHDFAAARPRETIFFDRRESTAALSQGITTVILGMDGFMNYPLREFFARFQETPASVNVASYVGHNVLRERVMGADNRRPATPAEIGAIRGLIAEEMRAGGLGLSTGLEYDSGIYSSRAEVIELAREAAAHGGRYISHIRSEDRHIWEAMDEIIEIGRAAKLPVQVTHLKLAMVDLWGQAGKILSLMDRARAQGIDITADVYPYEYWRSTLAVLFPDRDFGNRAAAQYALRHVARPDGLLITTFSPDPKLEDMTVAEIARLRGTDPAATLMALVAESRGPGARESVVATSMDAKDVEELIAWPHSNISSDGALDDGHPRGMGAYPRLLRIHVRERKTLSLESAIRKMSALGAEHVGIRDRGRISAGAFADLVLFDPQTVTDHATTKQPQAQSTGILKVWVNGRLAFENGRSTAAFSGRVIRRPRAGPVPTVDD